jgi:hypothetical protein
MEQRRREVSLSQDAIGCSRIRTGEWEEDEIRGWHKDECYIPESTWPESSQDMIGCVYLRDLSLLIILER